MDYWILSDHDGDDVIKCWKLSFHQVEVRPDMFHLNALLGSLGRRAAWCRAMHAVRAATAFDAVSARATWAALPREEWRQAVGSTEPGVENTSLALSPLAHTCYTVIT